MTCSKFVLRCLPSTDHYMTCAQGARQMHCAWLCCCGVVRVCMHAPRDGSLHQFVKNDWPCTPPCTLPHGGWSMAQGSTFTLRCKFNDLFAMLLVLRPGLYPFQICLLSTCLPKLLRRDAALWCHGVVCMFTGVLRFDPSLCTITTLAHL